MPFLLDFCYSCLFSLVQQNFLILKVVIKMSNEFPIKRYRCNNSRNCHFLMNISLEAKNSFPGINKTNFWNYPQLQLVSFLSKLMWNSINSNHLHHEIYPRQMQSNRNLSFREDGKRYG
jgi:hypothetical protein